MATGPPLDGAPVAACTAIDSLVYVPDRVAVVRELSDVLDIVPDLAGGQTASQSHEHH